MKNLVAALLGCLLLVTATSEPTLARDRDGRAAAIVAGAVIGAVALAASSHNHRHESYRPAAVVDNRWRGRWRPYRPAPRVTCYPRRRACYRDSGRFAPRWTHREFR